MDCCHVLMDVSDMNFDIIWHLVFRISTLVDARIKSCIISMGYVCGSKAGRYQHIEDFFRNTNSMPTKWLTNSKCYEQRIRRYTVYINKMLTHSQTMLYARASKFIFGVFSTLWNIFRKHEYVQYFNAGWQGRLDDNNNYGEDDNNDFSVLFHWICIYTLSATF